MATSQRPHRARPKELLNFLGYGEPEVPKNERELWLQEVALKIARTGAWGIQLLFAYLPHADEPRLRATLLALTLVQKKLSARQRAALCGHARQLLNDSRAHVVAEAVDTLTSLECSESVDHAARLLRHSSPYVVGSALRLLARRTPTAAVPLLEAALGSKEPIIRQNAVDELDEMNYQPALGKIRKLLQDPDKDVRQAARTAVAHLANGTA